ncbi:conserved hypothetical protein [Thiocapsa sp. KS1]|nr:conserved hypothetical protein [Thiocapsa sp. KS1]
MELSVGSTGRSWEGTIRTQRRAIALRLAHTPSLEAILHDAACREETWADAVAAATLETGLDIFPDNCPWPQSDILHPDWLPE